MPLFPFLLPSIAATLALTLYFVPPGYVFAKALNVAGFRERSFPEKLLWSVALSYPVSTVLAVLLGHFAGARCANGIFLLLGAIALVLGGRAWRRKQHLADKASRGDFRKFLPLLGCMALVVLLVWVATCAVYVRGHLMEGVFTNDWYIRLPLQWAAGASGVPPINPLFTLLGQNPTLRYYYFFYVLCAQPMRLFGLDARSVMVGGAAWVGVLFFSVCWLLLKRLLMPDLGTGFDAPGKLGSGRRLALVFFALSLVTGLDLLPNLPAIVGHQPPYPSVYWWSNYGVSSWPGFLPFIPHHFAGMSCGLLGYLLLTLSTHRRSRWMCALAAGICFAALLGTSTFLAITVYCCALALGVEAVWRRDAGTAAAVAGSLLLAAVLDAPYIRETFFPGATAGAEAGGRHFKLGVLHWTHARWLATEHIHSLARLAARHPGFGFAASVLLLLALYVVHWGFYGFVLWFRARQDLRGRALSREDRALWTFFATSTVLAVFVSSEPLQGGQLNDFGRLSSLIARVILMLWACPLLIGAWRRWRLGPALPAGMRLGFSLAAVCAVVGLLGAGYDVWMERVYLLKVDRGSIHPKVPFDFPPRVGEAYAQFEGAWRSVGISLPANAVLQANPDGLLQRPVLLYLNRRVAAGDISCETSFGGDKALCEQRVVRPLLALYAQSHVDDPRLRTLPATRPEDFVTVCQALRLSALIVDAYDPVWAEPQSWVWREPIIYAAPQVRVLRCPALEHTRSGN